MQFQILHTKKSDGHRSFIEQHSPQTVGYIHDAVDRDDYRCVVAVGDVGSSVGLCFVDLTRLGFGPLADAKVACLENIFVLPEHRRQGIGTVLLDRGLAEAWQEGAAQVWWTVPYEKSEAIAFYRSAGATFIAEEDPQAEEPERYYTVVIPNPDATVRRGG